MSTLDLVAAIINKDATSIDTAFNAAMADKISSRLEDKRQEMSQNMFNQEVETEYTDDEAV